ncbi:unnamed protein product, partial [Onchocerca ochengi]
HKSNFMERYWSPYQVILFGSENPLNISRVANFCYVLVVTSQENHLKIFSKSTDENVPFIPDEIKGSPMNGVIIPWNCFTLDMGLSYLTIKDIDEENKDNIWYALKYIRYRVKLAIVISSDDEITQEKAENRALKAAETIRKYLGFMPICVVAQSDIRMNVERGKKGKNLYEDSSVLIYYGNDVNASALVAYSEDEETLKNRFKIWKDNSFCLDDHQVIAFHFTMVNGSEPKNSEEIFSDVFPDIPISTLRLLGGPSTVGVNYPFGFDAGPVYVIIGWRKFGCGLSEEEIDVNYFYCDLSSSESSSETDYNLSDYDS